MEEKGEEKEEEREEKEEEKEEEEEEKKEKGEEEKKPNSGYLSRSHRLQKVLARGDNYRHKNLWRRVPPVGKGEKSAPTSALLHRSKD